MSCSRKIRYVPASAQISIDPIRVISAGRLLTVLPVLIKSNAHFSSLLQVPPTHCPEFSLFYRLKVFHQCQKIRLIASSCISFFFSVFIYHSEDCALSTPTCVPYTPADLQNKSDPVEALFSGCSPTGSVYDRQRQAACSPVLCRLCLIFLYRIRSVLCVGNCLIYFRLLRFSIFKEICCHLWEQCIGKHIFVLL